MNRHQISAVTLLFGSLMGLLMVGCGDDRPRNLLFVSLDTVRRDHLSLYGYERPTTPRLDSLAAQGVVFTHAFAQATNTAPSHASMFTGLYPHVHGVVQNGFPMSADGPPTLAEVLRRAGFRTGAFVSGYTLAAEVSGLERGFETYDDQFDENKRNGAETLDRTLDWLQATSPDDRFFLFVHLFDAHGPYQPSSDYAGLFNSEKPGPRLRRIARYQRLFDAEGNRIETANEYVDRYDALIRYQDDLLTRLLEQIDLTDTVVVITADHGETLGERYHSMDHGGRVFDEQIRIPLIVVAPELAPTSVESAVETIDLVPTVLDLLGLQFPEDVEIEGRSLLPIIAGDEDGRNLVYSTAQATRWRYGDRGYLLDTERQIRTVRSNDFKLIRYPGQQEDYLELYALDKDPMEVDNVADQYPQIVERLLDELVSWEGGWKTGVEPSRELDPEIQRRLRSLGYLGD